MNRNRLYILLSTACLSGYIWIVITFRQGTETSSGEIGDCLVKRITTIPCPSCGSTRSVLSLFKGDISGALFWNPFGLIIMAIMILAPIWILFDVIKGKSSMFRFYTQFELLLKQKRFAIPAILVVLGNWIWNIYKGL